MSRAGSTARAAMRGSAAAGPGSPVLGALVSCGGGTAAGWLPGVTASIAFRSHCPQERPAWPPTPIRYAA
eukprot:15453890-Alexandrium_andersonii.AAC.1